jgi:hypothetical protein
MDTVRAAIDQVNEFKKLQRSGFYVPMPYRIDCLGQMYSAIRHEAKRILGNETYESLECIYKEKAKRYVECNAKYSDYRLISDDQFMELNQLKKDMVDAEYNIVSCVYEELCHCHFSHF